ncbi:hypothetical protein [Streptomyces sp. SID5910]|uniref:hypothetical protein n=1 Tax=Streptomyces sp. SID5910 TaxID=2690312 RepID=UPI00136CCDF6|nr:hypothetical protein [Streptomyces sp. SID5910]MYR41274.1 hypothetical protein [Streptomyces sp. SID5910]
MEAKAKPGVETYRERAERRRRVRGTGDARGDGWQRTEADEQLLRLVTRYSTLTLHQAAAACWGGRIEAARLRTRLMTEAGLLHRSADVRWAGTVVWTTERGAQIAGTGLSAPNRPGERLLHRLALADVGLRLEAGGRMVLTEREVRAAEAVDGRAAELLADRGVPHVPIGARRGDLLAVPAGARAVHWPDLVVWLPGDGRLVAVEVELTPKPTAALRTILRAYRQAGRRVVYLGTEPVVRQLQGRTGPDGWLDGVAQDVGLLPRGGAAPAPDGGLLQVQPLRIADPSVAGQVARHASRQRSPG